MYRNTLKLRSAKSVIKFLGGIITASVDSQPTQDPLPVQYTELTHWYGNFLSIYFLVVIKPCIFFTKVFYNCNNCIFLEFIPQHCSAVQYIVNKTGLLWCNQLQVQNDPEWQSIFFNVIFTLSWVCDFSTYVLLSFLLHKDIENSRVFQQQFEFFEALGFVIISTSLQIRKKYNQMSNGFQLQNLNFNGKHKNKIELKSLSFLHV